MKDKRLTSVDPETVGSQWILIAMDRDCKLIPAFALGKRTTKIAWRLMRRLQTRITGRPKIVMDALEFTFFLSPMHLLYLDDSGSAGNRYEDYLVLGGVSVFEAQCHWVTRELDRLAEGIDPGNPHDVEFHASETFSRRKRPWNRMSLNDARGTIKAVLKVLADSYESARAFACVVHKASYPNRDPMEIAFEDLSLIKKTE